MGKGGCDSRLQELANRVQFALCLFVVIGPVISVIGAFLFLFRSGSEKDTRISILNSAILDYEEQLARFKDTTFEAAGMNLTIEQSADAMPTDQPSLMTYEFFRYTGILNQSTLTSDWELAYYYAGKRNVIIYQGNPLTSNFSVPFSSIPCRGATCRGSDCKYELCETACPKATKGSWDVEKQTCNGLRFINQMCVKFSPSGDSEWFIDRDGGGAGCFFNFKETADSLGNQGFPQYHEFLYSPENSPTSRIQIRLASDPYLAFSRESEGSFDIGAGRSPAYLAGYVMMIAGGCIFVTSIIFVPIFIHWKLGRGRAEKRRKTMRNGGLEERHELNE